MMEWYTSVHVPLKLLPQRVVGKIRSVIINSAADCWISLKFGTKLDLVIVHRVRKKKVPLYFFCHNFAKS